MFGITKATWGIVSTALVSVFVGYQYFDAKWKSRIERSLSYAVMYQQPEKVAARNASDLWPPNIPSRSREIDLNLITRSVAALSDPDVVKQYIPQANVLDDPEAAAKFREILADRVAENIARALINFGIATQSGDQPETVEAQFNLDEPDAGNCEQNIESFVGAYFDGNHEDWRDPDNYERWRDEISGADGLVTTMGTVREYTHEDNEQSSRVWSENDVVFYYYTWPDLLRKFFYQRNDADAVRIKVCTDLVEEYEAVLHNASADILQHLHELKHFYAAVSICTTSGLCDALVTCEIFNGDIIRFQQVWNKYLELWAASKVEVEYWRLPEFNHYCMSSKLFQDYSERKLSWYYGAPMLYVRGFTNFW